MKSIRYTAEFKAEAIKQITERGHTATDVAQCLGITTKSLYKWMQEADLAKQRVSCTSLSSLICTYVA